MSGKKRIPLNSDAGRAVLHPAGEGRSISPVVKAFAEAAKEVRRQTGKAPVYFSHEPKGTTQNHEGPDEVSETLPARVRAYVQDQGERVRESRVARSHRLHRHTQHAVRRPSCLSSESKAPGCLGRVIAADPRSRVTAPARRAPY